MGKRFRNFFKKRGKKKEEKKRKLKIGEIQVLFETGTSGPHAPFVPTTSGHADTPTITPEQIDKKTGQEDLCQENKLQERPKNQKRKGHTLVDRSQKFSDKLDEKIKQITAMEASMKEEDQRRKLHPLGEKRAMSPAQEKEAVSPSDRRACNSATKPSTVEGVESLLDRLSAHVQRSRHLRPDASPKIGQVQELSDGSNDKKKPSWQQPELPVKQDDKCPICNDMTGVLKRCSQMENLLSKILTFFERNSALTQVSTEGRLVQEIREVLGTDDTKLAVKTKTTPQNPHTPAQLRNLQLENWDDIIARRLEERKKSPWGRYLLSKEAATTSFIQSKQHSSDAGSSLIEFLLNIPLLKLLEPRPLHTNRWQQTQRQDYSKKWEEIHEQWRKGFSTSSDWSDETTTFYDALETQPPEERLI